MVMGVRFGDAKQVMNFDAHLVNERFSGNAFVDETQLLDLLVLLISYISKLLARMSESEGVARILRTARFSIFHSYSFGIRMENDFSVLGITKQLKSDPIPKMHLFWFSDPWVGDPFAAAAFSVVRSSF